MKIWHVNKNILHKLQNKSSRSTKLGSGAYQRQTQNPGLFDMSLKNLGFLGFLKKIKNLKSPNLGF